MKLPPCRKRCISKSSAGSPEDGVTSKLFRSPDSPFPRAFRYASLRAHKTKNAFSRLCSGSAFSVSNSRTEKNFFRNIFTGNIGTDIFEIHSYFPLVSNGKKGKAVRMGDVESEQFLNGFILKCRFSKRSVAKV